MKINKGFDESREYFSIITITKDDLAGLKLTIKSLEDQVYTNWEQIIVVDSNSKSSFDYAKNKSHFDKRIIVFNQVELGIYQAMNQGIRLASRDLLWFMNSGDEFYSRNTLKEVASFFLRNPAERILIGGYQIKDSPQKNYSFSNTHISPMRFSLNIRSGSHQSTIFRKTGLYQLDHFDTSFSIASDFKWILIQIRKYGAYRINSILSRIEPGGISEKEINVVLKEKQKIRTELFGIFSLNTFFGIFWTLGVKFKILFRKIFAKWKDA